MDFQYAWVPWRNFAAQLLLFVLCHFLLVFRDKVEPVFVIVVQRVVQQIVEPLISGQFSTLAFLYILSTVKKLTILLFYSRQNGQWNPSPQGMFWESDSFRQIRENRHN